MFEYVASGMNHTRISKKSLRDAAIQNKNDPTIELINAMTKSINRRHHKMSFLFNAYAEVLLGNIINDIIYKDTIYNTYADSGGLQMITLGHTSTPLLRKNVYNVQSNLSTIGMAFDEIPVETIGRSDKADTSGRLFCNSLMLKKAKETGENLREQIENFKDNPNNKCKPMMIIQGNCYDTYNRWADIVLKEVNANDWKYIKGISSGSAALGSGALEDFKRLFYMTHLDIPSEFKVNHYHLLGVGSLSRMLPVFPLINNGSITEDCLISYDSTTHTSSISNGKYFYNSRLSEFAKNKNKDFFNVVADINNNMATLGFGPINEDHLFYRICQPSLWNDIIGESIYDEFKTIFSYFISSVYNFMNCIDRLKDDTQYYEEFAISKKLLMPLKTYETCRDLTDFFEWENCFSKVLRSNSISNKKDVPVSLDTLF